MTFTSLSMTQRTSDREGVEVDKIRALVATHLGVDIGRVTDDAHFSDDLGADWLDRLELLILIEDQYAGVELMESNADQIESVGASSHLCQWYPTRMMSRTQRTLCTPGHGALRA